jgi:PTS system glucose-specific IIA component
MHTDWRKKVINKLFGPSPCILKAPVTGKLIDLKMVPDEAFSRKMLGDGIAIQAEDGLVVSPVKGRVLQIFPTNHALGIISDEGLEILIHLGIDTVELKGQGFTRLVKSEDLVEPGTPLIQMDLDIIRNNNKSLLSPIIITNMEKVKHMESMNGFVNAAKDNILKIHYRK